jgi:hypothetical protein
LSFTGDEILKQKLANNNININNTNKNEDSDIDDLLD